MFNLHLRLRKRPGVWRLREGPELRGGEEEALRRCRACVDLAGKEARRCRPELLLNAIKHSPLPRCRPCFYHRRSNGKRSDANVARLARRRSEAPRRRGRKERSGVIAWTERREVGMILNKIAT